MRNDTDGQGRFNTEGKHEPQPQPVAGVSRVLDPKRTDATGCSRGRRSWQGLDVGVVSRCAGYGCFEEALPDGQLCAVHQTRLDSGGGLPLAGEPVKGQQSGHGLYGIVDINDAGVLCHECGLRFAAVAQHSRRAHDLSAKEYRERHGIGGQSLTAPPRADGKPRRRAHPCRHCGTDLTFKGKLCPDCSSRFQQERRRRREQKQPPRPRWRYLTDTERSALKDSTHETLPDLIAALQEDRVPSRQIGEVLGLTPFQMSQQYPRPGWGSRPKRT